MNRSIPSNNFSMEAARRQREVLARLQKGLKNNRLAIIVGAGVTLSATADASGKPLSRIKWTGLIENGLDLLVSEGYVDRANRRIKRAYDALDDPDINGLLDAANILSSQLKQHGQFPTWLESVFGNLSQDLRHPAILEVLKKLHKNGAVLLTTNYDDVLETYCGLRHVGRSKTEDIVNFRRGDLDGVFHVHGSYHDPQEVVLDTTDYYQVKISDEVQGMLKAFLDDKIILFVGCGSGLEDPNFDELLKWAADRQKNIPNRHCLLAREGDSLTYNPLVTLRYGRSYEDLVPYLNALFEDRADAVTADISARKESYEEKVSDLLQLLPYAAQAPFNAYGEDDDPVCLANTRVETLQQIRDWADGNDKGHIFWLRGWAGTGKSTIARTVAREHYLKNLGASFFFSKGGGDTSHAGKFVTTIARQLAQNVPSVRSYICEAIAECTDIINQSLRDQWHQLVLDPLSRLNLNSRLSSFILVIDALDECDNKNHIQTILQLLAEARSLNAVRLRIFITSRPETPIKIGFYRIPEDEHQDFVLHNLSSSIVNNDLTIFLEHNLRLIAEECDLDASWPGEQVIRLLVQNASGLFIWAATACRFIRDGKYFAEKRLSYILQSTSPLNEPEKQLNSIYITVLLSAVHDRLLHEERDELYSMLRCILGSAVILASPLAVDCLSRLLDIDKQVVYATLKELHAILEIPKNLNRPLRLHHPSFRDFLLNQDRCTNPNFQVDEKQAHQKMADKCICLMSTALKQDICNQRSHGVLVADVESSHLEKCTSPELQYACLYWVQHLQRSGVQLHDNDQIHQFLKTHLLHWLEALSWMQRISAGILAINVLQTIAIAPNSDCPDLSAFIHDIKRFVLYSRSVIEQAPLQICCSALVFAPATSRVRTQFKDRVPRWLQKSPDVPKDWSALLQTLEGHIGWVRAVAFSPDGQLLASASNDRTVRLCDPTTGTAVQTLTGHIGWVTAVAFSPDGQLLASASDDGTVRLWDPTTGTAVQTLTGHIGRVIAVTFSPDGQLLVSASYDRTVRLWDPTTGTAVQTLTGHTSWVAAVAFSPDGQLLASASDDGTVRLWDPTTGTAVQTLTGHTGSVTAVAFSPDGQLLASASDDLTVRLWDPKTTRTAVQTLTGHTNSVAAVAFSPDGQLLASASYDETVRLWDLTKKTAVQTLEVNAVIHTLSFSVDGSCLETDRGLLDITTLSPDVFLPRPALPRGIFVKERWVARGKENLLWLPSDYRPTSVAVRGSVVVLGHASGRISFLEFALS